MQIYCITVCPELKLKINFQITSVLECLKTAFYQMVQIKTEYVREFQFAALLYFFF